jgi:predicted GNAT family acetyltransferase
VSDLQVVDRPASLRYEATLEDELVGVIEYRLDGDTIAMLHTEVEPHHEGEGIGSELVRRALDDVRANGKKLQPLCPFVRSFLDRHDEYRDLVAN